MVMMMVIVMVIIMVMVIFSLQKGCVDDDGDDGHGDGFEAHYVLINRTSY